MCADHLPLLMTVIYCLLINIIEIKKDACGKLFEDWGECCLDGGVIILGIVGQVSLERGGEGGAEQTRNSLRALLAEDSPRLWKDIWNSLNSRCGNQFLEGFPQTKHCSKPYLAFYHNLLHI